MRGLEETKGAGSCLSQCSMRPAAAPRTGFELISVKQPAACRGMLTRDDVRKPPSRHAASDDARIGVRGARLCIVGPLLRDRVRQLREQRACGFRYRSRAGCRGAPGSWRHTSRCLLRKRQGRNAAQACRAARFINQGWFARHHAFCVHRSAAVRTITRSGEEDSRRSPWTVFLRSLGAHSALSSRRTRGIERAALACRHAARPGTKNLLNANRRSTS